MPVTDALQPPLTPGERVVVKSYGGWTPFMQSMGLKPWKDEDAQEGKQIAATFAAGNEDDKTNSSSSKSGTK
ncbi:hypothetical protein N0V82_008988 [Gnomoniopsis sp. IMI 355080]|nr:hypothetical protein N0V82_008988 [Gnomoniopsis sp. IMI 355080]